MAKVLGMLEKMGLVNLGSEPQPVDLSDTDSEIETLRDEVESSSSGAAPVAQNELSLEPITISMKENAESLDPQDFPFERVYESAGISEPQHGFSVYKLIEMLEAEELSSLDQATRATVITGMLRHLPSGKVSMKDIIQDAALRDRALDAFEKFLNDRAAAAEQELAAHNQQLQNEIDEVTTRNQELIAANLACIGEEQERLAQWQERKRREESRLYDAISPFVEANPITIDSDDDEGSS